ncbi:MAG: hypothetical protein ACRC2T_18415 [Thermoguttaceae bacterium]
MSKEADQAVANYTQVPKIYNCAQAVAKAFDQNDLLDPMQMCGGGKAPGGLCGALHASLQLLPESKHEQAKQLFQDKTESLLCREIRQMGKTKCADCVRIAADNLVDISVNKH